MRMLASRSACAFLIIRRTHIAPCHRTLRVPLEMMELLYTSAVICLPNMLFDMYGTELVESTYR